MKIFLRPITINDSHLIVKWRNNSTVLSHCMSKIEITEESHLKFFKENIETGKYKQFIVESLDDDFAVVAYPIATVYLKDMDYNNKRCELCIFTSSDREWRSESQSIAIKMLVEKAFNEYGMHKVYSYVFYKYSNEIELLKHAGFEVEAMLKSEAQVKEDHFEDIVRLSIFKK